MLFVLAAEMKQTWFGGQGHMINVKGDRIITYNVSVYRRYVSLMSWFRAYDILSNVVRVPHHSSQGNALQPVSTILTHRNHFVWDRNASPTISGANILNSAPVWHERTTTLVGEIKRRIQKRHFGVEGPRPREIMSWKDWGQWPLKHHLPFHSVSAQAAARYK